MRQKRVNQQSVTALPEISKQKLPGT
jgi:hypothetical protein